MGTVTYANTPATLDQETLRSADGVRIVTAEEEGTGVNALPSGVYGFTYAPALANAPVWAVRRYRSYETHKLADGEVYIIGFADVATAAQLESPGEQTILIQPAPEGDANLLVKIPYARISRHKQVSVPNQQGFTVTLQNPA
jgi:hypothetical protein